MDRPVPASADGFPRSGARETEAERQQRVIARRRARDDGFGQLVFQYIASSINGTSNILLALYRERFLRRFHCRCPVRNGYRTGTSVLIDRRARGDKSALIESCDTFQKSLNLSLRQRPL